MFSFKKSLTALVGLLVLVVTLVALEPRVSRGQGNNANAPPPFDVKVINSPSEPVPVTGTVSVSNLGANPLPVRDVDNPARNPFQAQVLCTIQAGTSGKRCTITTVPQGKRLVIELVTVLWPICRPGKSPLSLSSCRTPMD